MSVRYVYVNLKDSPVFGVTAHNPPVTGGIVVGWFESPETDHGRLLELAGLYAPPFRVEYRRGQSWALTDTFPASQDGLDAALTWGGAQARMVKPARIMAGDTLVHEWPADA
jgi:hypothetical protein